MARAIALGWGGGRDRDAKAARESRALVMEHAPKSLAEKLKAHGMNKTPRISTAARLARAVLDCEDSAVDGDELLDAFAESGGTGFALALASPKHAKDVLRERVNEHELDLSSSVSPRSPTPSRSPRPT